MQKSEIIKKYKEKNIKFDYKVEERTEKEIKVSVSFESCKREFNKLNDLNIDEKDFNPTEAGIKMFNILNCVYKGIYDINYEIKSDKILFSLKTIME
ncbi:hypothetical protein LCGC14_0854850 [marine sediment metagenome]|uniref:Uncharacterized protein n=1 Tax=marine sediment metagenome TaxID=412755 RepID=A0A0F9PE02_9ZZZZ